MSKKQELYNDNWICSTRSENLSSSWAQDVLADIDGDGGVYLSTIRSWFQSFPFANTGQSKHLKKRLENLVDEDHVGAVNELFWYNLARLLEWRLQLLAEKKSAPDFKISSPSCFYCEVTTLNISKQDRDSVEKGAGARLNHEKETARILRKAVDEKIEQLRFGYNAQKPSVLVVFDYSTFSGLGTQRPHALAEALLGSPAGLKALPKELSVLLYLERYISEGRFRLRLSQSAAYHNPLADYTIEKDTFGWIKQFAISGFSEIPPHMSMDLLVV